MAGKKYHLALKTLQLNKGDNMKEGQRLSRVWLYVDCPPGSARVHRGLASCAVSISGGRWHTVRLHPCQSVTKPELTAAHTQQLKCLHSVMPAARTPGEEILGEEQVN